MLKVIWKISRCQLCSCPPLVETRRVHENRAERSCWLALLRVWSFFLARPWLKHDGCVGKVLNAAGWLLRVWSWTPRPQVLELLWEIKRHPPCFVGRLFQIVTGSKRSIWKSQPCMTSNSFEAVSAPNAFALKLKAINVQQKTEICSFSQRRRPTVASTHSEGVLLVINCDRRSQQVRRLRWRTGDRRSSWA